MRGDEMVEPDLRLTSLQPAAAPPAGAPPAGASPTLEARFAAEGIAWLTTVRPDGAPHVVPVWFLWDSGTFIVFSKPTARKVRNIAAEGRVMLAIGDPAADFDVQLIDGEAHLIDRPAIEVLDARLVAKYGPWMADVSLSPAEFAATYSQVIRVVPTRYLPWRGRTGGRPIGEAAGPNPGPGSTPAGGTSGQPIRAATRHRGYPIRVPTTATTYASARPDRRNHPSVAFTSGRPRVSFAPRGL
jgi:PPOX class probable F420-dependent enzyme